MNRGLLLRVLALVFAAIGLILLAWYFWALPKTLRVAVGPPESPQHRFAVAMARAMKDTQQSYKIEIVPVADSAAASAALDKHKVDLAVLRSDDASSAEARAVAVLQRRQLIVIVRRDGPITSLADLKGRPTALVNIGAESNRNLFATILQHFEIAAKEVPIEEIEAQALAGSSRRFDAYVLFANAATGLPRTVLDTVARQVGEEVVPLAVAGAEGMALRFRELQRGTIPAGAFGGSVPMPAEALNTVSFSHELVATSELGQSEAKDLLTNLIDSRTRIRRLLPRTSFDIEAPPVGEQRRFLPHNGAAAYVNDDDAETFLETYSEQIWLALFGVSLLGSSVAGILGWTGWFDARPRAGEALEDRTRALAQRIGGIDDVAGLDAAQRELDDIVLAHLHRDGKDGAATSDVPAWLACLGDIIARRRALLLSAAAEAGRRSA